MAASPIANVVALMPPTKGLNLVNPAISLDPSEALVLDNILPMPQSGELRGGFTEWVVGIQGVIQTIASFSAKLPKDNAILAFNTFGQVFDVTLSATSPDPLATTLNPGGVWDYTNATGLTDNFLCMVSPLGGYWTYSVADGFKQRQLTGAGAGKTFSAVFNFKNRLWFIENESSRCYYLPVGEMWGDVKLYDFSSVLSQGGFISYGTDWTYNAGKDINDYLILVTTRGEVIVYTGSDPGDAANFSLQGVWYIGNTPSGNQCFCQFGGELFIMSALGIVPVSKLVNGGVANEYQVSSYKISPQLIAIFNAYQADFGWAMDMIYNQTFLLLQLPITRSGKYVFYTMNTTTGAWATISGMPMNCATQINSKLYFGTTDGRICLAFEGNSDGVSLDKVEGKPIIGRYTGGMSNYGSGVNLKTFQLARPAFMSSRAPSVGAKILTQFPMAVPTISPADGVTPGGHFDVDFWNECVWGGGFNTFTGWVGLEGLGYYGALAISFTGMPKTQYVTTNVTFTAGGVM